MSKARKYKYNKKEIEEEFKVPTSIQTIVKVVEPKGNNLHAVEEPSGNQYLVSMPQKYRNSHWIKKGDFIVIEPIQEGDKVKAEIVSILDKVRRNDLFARMFIHFCSTLMSVLFAESHQVSEGTKMLAGRIRRR